MSDFRRFETGSQPLYMSEWLAQSVSTYLPYMGAAVSKPTIVLTCFDFEQGEIFLSHKTDSFRLDAQACLNRLAPQLDGLIELPDQAHVDFTPEGHCMYTPQNSRNPDYHVIYMASGLPTDNIELAHEIANIPYNTIASENIRGDEISWFVHTFMHEAGHTHQQLGTHSWHKRTMNEIMADQHANYFYKMLMNDGYKLTEELPEQLIHLRSIGVLQSGLRHRVALQNPCSNPETAERSARCQSFVHYSPAIFADTNISPQELLAARDDVETLADVLGRFKNCELMASGFNGKRFDREELRTQLRSLTEYPEQTPAYLRYLLHMEDKIPISANKKRLCQSFIAAAEYFQMDLREDIYQEHEATIYATGAQLLRALNAA